MVLGISHNSDSRLPPSAGSFVLIFSLILLVTSISVYDLEIIPEAFAWKVETHLYFANEVLDDLCSDGSILIEDKNYLVDATIATAICSYPQYYRAGTVGPDGFPDLMSGQGTVHPDLKCYVDKNNDGDIADFNEIPPNCIFDDEGTFTYEWLEYVYEKGITYQGDKESKKKVLAFTYGYLSHAAMDTFAHTLVNEYAEGVFPSVGEVLSDSDQRKIALRHIVVEGYIAEHTPDTVKTIDSPNEFLEDIFIGTWTEIPNGDHEKYHFERAPSDPRMNIGGAIDYFLGERERLVEKRQELTNQIDEDFGGCELNPIDCTHERYLERWIDDIDEGLMLWTDLSEEFAIEMFTNEDPRAAIQVYKDFVKVGSGPGFASMLGAPDALGFVFDIIGGIADIVSYVLGPLTYPVDWIVENVQQWLLNLIFGDLIIEVEEWIDHIQSPSRHINGQTGLGLASDTSQSLDELMGISDGINNPDTKFNPNNFAAAKNSIVLSKLILLDDDPINDVLCDRRTGEIFGDVDYFGCIPPFEIPSLPEEITWIEYIRECNDPLGSTVSDGRGCFDMPISYRIPIEWKCDAKSVIKGKTDGIERFSEQFVMDFTNNYQGQQTVKALASSLGTAQINIIPEKYKFTSTDTEAFFEVWVNPVVTDRNVMFKISNDDGDVFYSNDMIGYPQGLSFQKCIDKPRQVIIFPLTGIPQGSYTLEVKYINAEAKLSFEVSADDDLENIMLGWNRSIDGHQQWRAYSIHPDYTHDRQYGEGMPFWNDCPSRDRVFRDIFDDWSHQYPVDANFPPMGEITIPRISTTPYPNTWIQVYGDRELIEGDVVLIPKNATIEVFALDQNPLWQLQTNEIKSYLDIGGPSKIPPGISGEFGGNKTMSDFCGNNVFVHYYGAGQCNPVPSENKGELEEHQHIGKFSVGENCPYNPAVEWRTFSCNDLFHSESIGLKQVKLIGQCSTLLEIVHQEFDLDTMTPRNSLEFPSVCDPRFCTPLQIEDDVDPTVLTRMADEFNAMGNFDISSKLYRTAIYLEPDNDKIMADFAISMVDNNFRAEGKHFLNKAVEINPRNTESKILLGKIHHSEGDFDKAISFYDDALKISDFKELEKLRSDASLKKPIDTKHLPDVELSLVKPVKIPSWIKNNAGWWADGSIDDSSFIQGIQYMIKEGVMNIPPTNQGTSTEAKEIPSWIKNNAGWWADGSIDDDSFIQGMQYLIKEGIMIGSWPGPE